MRVLITAGPTREPMDPVRYLTNASSGAMGFAVAEAFQKAGANVTVVSGPSTQNLPKKVRILPVTTALEMSNAVKRNLVKSDVFVATAAVCDFRFAKSSPQKLKKGSRSTWTVGLVRNPDILEEAGRWKKKLRRSRPVLVGFALETNRILFYMAQKLKEKNLDLIVGNSPASFAGPRITPLWLEEGARVKKFPRMTKKALATKIVSWTKKQLS